MKSIAIVACILSISFVAIPSVVSAGAIDTLSNGVSKTFAMKSGYDDATKNEDNVAQKAASEAAAAAGTIGASMAGASLSGAGGLTGYAGMAAAVSNLGLGGLTTTAAGMMGSSATGAAATSLVTATVGGPVVMCAIIIGGSAATVYLLYKGGQYIGDKFQ